MQLMQRSSDLSPEYYQVVSDYRAAQSKFCFSLAAHFSHCQQINNNKVT